MINLSEIASSTEERVLSSVKAGQDLVIDSLKNVLALADRVVPVAVGERIEDQVSSLPSASPVVDGAFSFAAKMLDAQREFAGEVVAIFQPAPAKVAPAKKAPVAKKAPAKRAPAKKAAAKSTKKAA